MSEKWSASDITEAKYLGPVEFQTNSEWNLFEILQTPTRLVFGGMVNVGFLESGYMELDEYFSLDENLQELIADLEAYYNEGPSSVAHITCNERM